MRTFAEEVRHRKPYVRLITQLPPPRLWSIVSVLDNFGTSIETCKYHTAFYNFICYQARSKTLTASERAPKARRRQQAPPHRQDTRRETVLSQNFGRWLARYDLLPRTVLSISEIQRRTSTHQQAYRKLCRIEAPNSNQIPLGSK